MKNYLTIILIGLVSGFIGILPLLRMKMDKYFLLAVFVFYMLMPYVIFHMSLSFKIAWWFKGSAISLGLVLPLVIAAGKGYKRSVFPMLLTALIIGILITFLGHYLL